MKVSTIREFRDNATRLMRGAEPLLVTRRGRLAGVFLPWTEATLPADLKRELFLALTAEVSRQMKQQRVSEEEVLADFEDWKKTGRAARRGR